MTTEGSKLNVSDAPSSSLVQSQGSFFEHSTHKGYWLFSADQLQSTREKVHKRSVERLDPRRRSLATPNEVVQPTPGSPWLDPTLKIDPMTCTPVSNTLKPSHRMSLGTDRQSQIKRMSLGTDIKPPMLHLTQDQVPSTPNVATKLKFDQSPMDMPMDSPLPIPLIHESPSPQAPPIHVIKPESFGPIVQPDILLQEQNEMPPPLQESTKKRGPPLTLEEEGILKLFYEFQIHQISADFKFPLSVPASAIAYFKRFYLTNSLMDYNPKLVMVTSISLACKAEERYISILQLAEHTGTKATQIVKWEVPVLEGILFHLMVFHPYRPLVGLIQAIESWKPEFGPVLRQMQPVAQDLIMKSYYTDLLLLYPPSQIAVAALQKAASQHKADDIVPKYLLRNIQSHFANEIHFGCCFLYCFITDVPNASHNTCCC